MYRWQQKTVRNNEKRRTNVIKAFIVKIPRS